ncbi:SLAP domain-containing protein [Caldibacillus lycopersici]|uniref:SLAP domain-containing protein n=1 Tax=Perspicuibacillus lycopersici TaxID=1325689 RepID=A0AAE3LU19_9BACI|nr:SLAP domain-containing protein [Perspicuibacillus lycopersici]MCU9614983.1 SLAP domain-containing protein [Perspicuibacillus lycopersici]
MQQLVFEAAWNKTIADIDRRKIEQAFHLGKISDTFIHFQMLWSAINHRGELLITVLIHNPTDKAVQIRDEKIVYVEKEETVAENIFTFPTLEIGAYCSLPWTFIFPTHKKIGEQSDTIGRTEYVAGELLLMGQLNKR